MMMMAASHAVIEDQESVTDLGNGEIIDSLSDDADSGPPRHVGNFSDDATVILPEGSLEYDVVSNCFLYGMGPFASDTTIVTICKISTEKRVTTKAKLAAFRVFAEAVARKNGGDANFKYGWYSSGSKEEIDGIVSYGFSNREIEKFENDNGSHGVGIHLVHHRCSLAAALASEADEKGLKHLLLCRLILGKSEEIISGSKQSYPSSSQFDSGVDNLENPRKYVMWSCSTNSYILPSHVVSFRSPRLSGCRSRAKSPCVSFSVLISTLSKLLDLPTMNVILRTYDDFRKGKMRREQLVRKMREVVGDDLLSKIIKHHKV